MYLPSFLTMDCSEVIPDKPQFPLESDEIDEAAEDIAEAHSSLRFLAKYTESPEARARLVAAMRAIEFATNDIAAMQESARKREAE